MSDLKSIEGHGHGPKPHRRRALDESEQVSCWKCVADTGVATSTVVRVRIAPRRRPDGRIVGGRDAWACAHCLSRGIVTELVKP